MKADAFFAAVSRKLGGAGPDQVDHSMRAVLATLGACLPRAGCADLAEVLPERLAAEVLEAEHGAGFDDQGLYARVAERAGLSPGDAREHAQVVLREVAHALGADAVTRLRGQLPDSWAPLFEVPAPSPPPTHAHLDPARTTLAEGHGGGGRPLYAAAAPGAQSQSVAAANPHADTKLSSAQGLTQEREGETLATGGPGAQRGLADAGKR